MSETTATDAVRDLVLHYEERLGILITANRQQAAEIAALEALVGTVRELAGCQVRNVSDVDVETHSREIGAEIAALRSRLNQVRLLLARHEGVRGVVLDRVREIVGEKWIAESNPGTPPDPRGAR